MIPVLIVLGVVLGRWWRTALAAGVVAWVVALLVTGTIDGGQVPVAALLALVNTGVGVLAHQGVLLAYRQLRCGP